MEAVRKNDRAAREVAGDLGAHKLEFVLLLDGKGHAGGAVLGRCLGQEGLDGLDARVGMTEVGHNGLRREAMRQRFGVVFCGKVSSDRFGKGQGGNAVGSIGSVITLG